MEIKGIIAAMATAMYEDGSINESEIRNQVNRHIQAGVDGIFCLGTNGEFYILSTEEKKRVMRICVDEARGRVPVYAGTGCVGTQDTIDLSLAAQEIGVDVLSIITPYFAALNQEELYRHYWPLTACFTARPDLRMTMSPHGRWVRAWQPSWVRCWGVSITRCMMD